MPDIDKEDFAERLAERCGHAGGMSYYISSGNEHLAAYDLIQEMLAEKAAEDTEPLRSSKHWRDLLNEMRCGKWTVKEKEEPSRLVETAPDHTGFDAIKSAERTLIRLATSFADREGEEISLDEREYHWGKVVGAATTLSGLREVLGPSPF